MSNIIWKADKWKMKPRPAVSKEASGKVFTAQAGWYNSLGLFPPGRSKQYAQVSCSSVWNYIVRSCAPTQPLSPQLFSFRSEVSEMWCRLPAEKAPSGTEDSQVKRGGGGQKAEDGIGYGGRQHSYYQHPSPSQKKSSCKNISWLARGSLKMLRSRKQNRLF